MSFLKDILKESELAVYKELREKCEKVNHGMTLLTEQMDILVWNLQNILHDYYVNLQAKNMTQINLSIKMCKINEEYNRLLTLSNEIITQYSEECFQHELNKFQKTYNILNVLVQMVTCKKKIEEISMELYKLNYDKVYDLLFDVHNFLFHIDTHENDIENILDKLRDDFDMKYALCVAQISVELEECFKFSEDLCHASTVQTIEIDHSDISQIHKYFKVLHKCERLNVQLLSFSEFFICKLLNKITKYKCLITSDEHLKTIVLTIKYDQCDKIKPSIQDCLINLTAVLDFLHTTIDVVFDDGNTFISVLADMVSDDFFKVFTENCLKYVLPDSDSKLVIYEGFISELEVFNSFLASIKFIQHETSPLKAYLNRCESILYEKKTNRFLFEAKMLMKQSLQLSTKIVGAENDTDPKLNESINSSNDITCILNAPNFFHRCKVSNNVVQILNLVFANLNEATELPEYLQRNIVGAVKSVAVMYQTLVPKLNEESLKNNYLDIALFFNNCFYLAHGFLGPPWQKNLPRNMADNLSALLLDEIQNLRVLGLNAISQCLQEQKKFIMDTIKPNDATSLTLEYCNDLNYAISQSLLRVQTLTSIWQGVLPKNMYENVISSILSNLCQAIISRLLGCQEQGVSEEVTLNIALKIEETIEQIPQYFEQYTDLSKAVNGWDRLKHIVELLRVQQHSLASSWSASESELAAHFSCEEIRKIIKMRFPDEDFRIRILALVQ